MSDDVDSAQATETMLRAEAIRRARTCASATPPTADDASCTTCGEEIDDERRQALPGVRRCLQCQEARERLQRLMRKG